MSDLVWRTAVEQRALLTAGEVSAAELLEAHLDQIERVNPAVNAVVTLVADEARRAARDCDSRLANGEDIGLLGGLPVVHKDLVQTRGIRTTMGSPVLSDWVPKVDALIVQRMKHAGAVTVGKSNTPEFGAGSQTFNPVFGATLNPWDLGRTCGGSSGGAAVALACGMVPLADGSDMGGSLRNPANFCGVVGFRTSPGRVPIWPNQSAWGNLGVQGPMARTVEDTALFLAAIAGPDARSPIALEEPGSVFLGSLEKDFRGARLAWSDDFGGLPIHPDVSRVLEFGRAVLVDLGLEVEDACPDLEPADQIFKTQRAFSFATTLGETYRRHRERMKDTVVWNIEAGLELSSEDLALADLLRSELYQEACGFFDDFDFLVGPVSQVPPFDVDREWISEINGVEMATYIDWMKSCYYITVLGLPAISVPCGFTDDGLPVGVQIVGGPRCDREVLELATAFEKAAGVVGRRPPVADAESSSR